MVDYQKNKSQRLNDVFEKLRYDGVVKSKKEFAEKINIDKTNLSSAFNGVDKYLTDGMWRKITESFPQFNLVWLQTGEGEMLKDAPDNITSHFTVPLLPVSAQGGSLNDFIASVELIKCEEIASPIRGMDFAMTIAGDSMTPEYPSGSIIYVKRINERAFIEWGKVYVLDTCNGSVIKRIMPVDADAEKVRCESTNSAFPPFEVKFSDMYGMYRVVFCMSRK